MNDEMRKKRSSKRSSTAAGRKLQTTAPESSSSKVDEKSRRRVQVKMKVMQVVVQLLLVCVFQSLVCSLKIEHEQQRPPFSTAVRLSQPPPSSSSSANSRTTATAISATSGGKPLRLPLNQIYGEAANFYTNNNNHNSFNKQLPTAGNNGSGQRSSTSREARICIGTSKKLEYDASLKLAERYTNCTHVIGNLEIAFVESQAELAALESIREITGYLLIHQVKTDRIRLPNLRIIRGKDQFRYTQDNDTIDFAMILIENEQLKTLELPELREILQGNFGAYYNRNLCTLNTIKWDEILNPGYVTKLSFVGNPPECAPCDAACHGAPGCWSVAPDMCQLSGRTICSPLCPNRCFGPSPTECCHLYCAGGCTGPNVTDCEACKNFDNDGACVPECPPLQVYDSGQYKHDTNPLGKYAFGATCVKECPRDLLRDNGACVRDCPANKLSMGGECIPCGGPGRIPCDSPDYPLIMLDAAGGSSSSSSSLSSSSSSNSSAASAAQSSASSSSSSSSIQATSSVAAGATNLAASPQVPTSGEQQSPAGATSGKQSSLFDCKPIINSTSQLAALDPSSPSFQATLSAADEQSNQSPAAADCIKLDAPCPAGYFQDFIASTGRPVCRRCHHRCQRCTGMGTHVSVCECARYVAGEQCEDDCPRDYYPDEQSRRCSKCSPECNGCSGPTEADCHACRVYRVYSTNGQQQQQQQVLDSAAPMLLLESNNIIEQPDNQPSKSSPAHQQRRPFNCTSQCPPDKPYRISDSTFPDLYCSEMPDTNPDAAPLRTGQTLGLWTSIPLLLIVAGAVGSCLWVHRLELEKDKKVKLAIQMQSGIDDIEPLNPSNLKPNLASLKSIQETELRKGNELGSGFGGTVYQGLWYPEGRKNDPRPVAIKVLRDNGQSNMNKKFLDEAYIMASVDHPNLVKLLAVCMTPKHLMLVTPLMPLGCLLDHVQKHQHEISAKNLLEWSKQIAKGMAYLEEHRMVHRDLALRNVLLKTCGRAMISDFGLAKFLEIDQSEYHSLGGRLPIKWLAPECIRERRFTHKSDVWAFGVTVWELLTFGAQPFEEYSLKDMLSAIENGARLEQPPYLTTEVYSVMLSCWFYKSEARPTFRQLTQDFVKFAQDPQRYVAIGSHHHQDFSAGGATFEHSPSGNTSKFARMNNFATKFHQQQHHQQHDIDIDEYNDSDLDQSQSSSLVDQEDSGCDQLAATSELTPSTHNRINETLRYGFDFKRHHLHLQQRQQQHQSASESTSSDICQRTPLSPKRIHFPSDQRLIEEVDYDDTDVFKPISSQQQHLDGNNNFIIVSPADTWQHAAGGSLSQSPKSSEQPPTDMYDYLLPSPCTNDSRNFNQIFGPTGSEHLSKKSLPRANCIRSTSIGGGGGGGGRRQRLSSTGTMGRSATLKAGQTLKAHMPLSHQQHHLSSSIIGVDNYEYFTAKATSGAAGHYLSSHYADMDPADLAAALQLERSQHLSASNGNIPHSLV